MNAIDTEDEAAPFAPLSPDDLAVILTAQTCLRKCLGLRGNSTRCCKPGDRDYIIGPIPDADALLERLSEKFGRSVGWREVFIDFEEGAALHPEKPSWQLPACYPALRVDEDHPDLPCRFLGADNLCTIYEIRSVTCRTFECSHLTTVLEALSRRVKRASDKRDAALRFL